MEGGAGDGPLPEDGPDSGDSAAQFIESVLSLLFLQKFDQFDQMDNALRSHLKSESGRASLARVLTERQAQWSSISNKGVAERAVGMLALAFDQLESAAAMDRVTGKRSFEKESRTALDLIEMGQLYGLQPDGDKTEGTGTPARCSHRCPPPAPKPRAERARACCSDVLGLQPRNLLHLGRDAALARDARQRAARRSAGFEAAGRGASA